MIFNYYYFYLIIFLLSLLNEIDLIRYNILTIITMNDVMLMSPGSSSNFLEVDTLVKHLSNHETDGSTEKREEEKLFSLKC